MASAIMVVAAAACSATPAAAFSECVMFSGTADGIVKPEAVDDSRGALQEAIGEWRTEHPGVTGVMSAAKPKPKPYWRSGVRDDLYVSPVVDRQAYTLCWHGVVSPYVCTSGARLCH
ncbi:hypothetical protein V6C03_04805 [Methyloligella sp. 2.7D]|uniref:hypothetical protein n=1 Tax=unclassified Methyloligella TaxID=2625955 RepID=UPI00157D1DB2|nr:hypothetical protein [Methyloligella sp. GL2]QKP76086.1 hypothetical protein HT051_00620 [Methyloligella sp. GL2]